MRFAFVGRRWSRAVLVAWAGIVTLAATPLPARGADCHSPAVASCDRDYGDGTWRTHSVVFWCYLVRTALCSTEM